MRGMLFALVLWASVGCLRAQRISYVKDDGSWYHLYDQKGKKIHTYSSTIGQLMGYSASILVVKAGPWIHVYDEHGKKLATLSDSSVGQVLSVTGDTFASRQGSWIYVWSKEGKKLQTRSAQ